MIMKRKIQIISPPNDQLTGRIPAQQFGRTVEIDTPIGISGWNFSRF